MVRFKTIIRWYFCITKYLPTSNCRRSFTKWLSGIIGLRCQMINWWKISCMYKLDVSKFTDFIALCGVIKQNDLSQSNTIFIFLLDETLLQKNTFEISQFDSNIWVAKKTTGDKSSALFIAVSAVWLDHTAYEVPIPK